MRNVSINSSIERMKQLMNHGSQDTPLKPNVSETVEYKTNGPDNKVYGIVRERQKYYIKESKDGISFDYIGGLPNKQENEYPSYNSAFRNLELKIRAINESLNNNKVFEVLPPNTTSEYIIEATEDMRKELDRFKQITNGAEKIMNESGTEFINKPKFKDPESFGTATDPKKQGQPFSVDATANLDKDPKFKATDPKKQGQPFSVEAKPQEDSFDIEKTSKSPSQVGNPFNKDAEDVIGDSVATKKPKGGKQIKITESQFIEARKRLSEMYDDDDMFASDVFGGVDVIDSDEDDDYKYDAPEFDDDENEDENVQLDFPIPSRVKYVGSEYPGLLDKTFDYVGKTPSGYAYLSYTNKNTGKEMELDPAKYRILPNDLERVGLNESSDDLNEGFWDSAKAIGSVGKYFGNKATQGVKNTYDKATQGVKNVYDKTAQGVDNIKQQGSRVYNQSQQNSSAAKIQQIATNLKAEIDNLNNRTVKAGGQPLNINSVIATISNQLRGSKGIDTSRFRAEEVEPELDDNLVNEITEAVLNAFGQHHTYQKPAFTTSGTNGTLKPGTREWHDDSTKGQSPYGQKIGNSAPFTNPVKQKVGEGEIGEDADDVMKGKTPQGLPSLGQKGDKAPFDKPLKKTDVLNSIAESILIDLKKKS